MRLTEQEYNLYMSVHPQLCYHAGIKTGLLKKQTSFQDFMMLSSQKKFPMREALYDDISLLDSYIKENKRNLSGEQIEVIQGFKDFKKGNFYIIKLLKDHALFMNSENGEDHFVFGVLALSDPFQTFFSVFPVMLKAVLLPFQNKIVYDGMLQSYPMMFGKNMRGSINNNFTLAKGQYGVITQLPIPKSIKNKKVDQKAKLSLLLKTKASREHNWYEIDELIASDPKLLPHYYKEWGRINTRQKRKSLKELGLKGKYFAIYNDTIVTSGKNQKETELRVKEMISDKDILDSIHYFKV